MTTARIPFTEADEKVLSQLAGSMTFIAIAHFLGALLAFVGSCILLSTGLLEVGMASQLGGARMAPMMVVMGVVVVVVAAVLVFQGVLLVSARTSFLAVVRTDEADQAHLSAGFRKLKLFFLVEVILGVLGLVSNAGQIVAGLAGAA